MPLTAERESRTMEKGERMPGYSVEVRNIATYQTPIVASLKGRPVKIVATGDAPGHSPVCQYIDDQGHLDWEEQDRFVVVDTNFLPPSTEVMREVTRTFNR